MKKIHLKRKTKIIRPSSIPEFCSLFNKHFQTLKGYTYLDSNLMIVTKRIELDLLALDDLLHERHGDYEENMNISMAEIIKREYGKDAYLFVCGLIN